jgi:hypothetical protein
MADGRELFLKKDGAQIDFPSASFSAVYEWFGTHFPAWTPDVLSDGSSDSRTIFPAQIPESPNAPAGLIHFKSITDCIWSNADLTSLNRDHPWILLILSPFERFYELDPLIEEMSMNAHRLVIWRPDRPTAEESARLRVNSLVPAVEDAQAGASKKNQEALRILHEAFVVRGSLIIQGIRHSVIQEIGNFQLQQYISACLRCVAASSAPPQAKTRVSQQAAVRWANLLCANAGSVPFSSLEAESEARKWAAAHLESQSGLLPGGIHPIPEPFLTKRYRDEAKDFDSAWERIRPTLIPFVRGELTCETAMAQISQAFGGDEERLHQWKMRACEVPEILRWQLHFEDAHRYLNASFSTDDPEVEQRRLELKRACSEPHRFLQPSPRSEFDIAFMKFKSRYIDFYATAHENSAEILADPTRMRSRLNPISLRNLELMSQIKGANRGFLNQVRALGKKIEEAQCSHPVRAILQRHPVCYCNMRPCGNRSLPQYLDQMNTAIADGIRNIRSILQSRKSVIGRKLDESGADAGCAREIAALLGEVDLPPISTESIRILNQLL